MRGRRTVCRPNVEIDLAGDDRFRQVDDIQAQVPITRVGPIASLLALMFRPAIMRFLMLFEQ